MECVTMDDNELNTVYDVKITGYNKTLGEGCTEHLIFCPADTRWRSDDALTDSTDSLVQNSQFVLY